jgi:hypothetical protein
VVPKSIEFLRLIAFALTREPEVYALETLARAWAADALSGDRIEQGAVGGALQVMAVRRQERAGTPVEFGAAVRAAINEHAEHPLPAKCNQAAFLEVYPQARALWDRVKRGSVGRGESGDHGIGISEQKDLRDSCAARLDVGVAFHIRHPVYILPLASCANGCAVTGSEKLQ